MATMIKRTIIIGLFIIQAGIYGQAINDFGTWWGVEVRKTFLNDFRAAVQAEMRLNENSQFTKNFFIEPSIKYTPIKWLSITANYRFDNRYEKVERYFTQRHRISLDLGFSYEVKRFEFEYRNRFQMHWENYYSSNIEYPIMFSRNQIGVTYKWPQLPFSTNLSGEIWLPIESNTELSKFRLVVAQEYKLKKLHRFQLRFVFQTDLNKTDPWRDYILSARYIIAF